MIGCFYKPFLILAYIMYSMYPYQSITIPETYSLSLTTTKMIANKTQKDTMGPGARVEEVLASYSPSGAGSDSAMGAAGV